MWQSFWRVAAIVGVLLAVGVWASANSTFLFRHPLSPEARIVVDPVTKAAIVTGRIKTAAEETAESKPDPRAVPDETEFDFGTMDPLTMGKHAFVIRNKGNAPLKLEVGPTTCKCTVSGLASKEVLPGEFTTVTLEWNTGRHLHYAHSGTIYTNDPLRKSLDLRVQGRVRMLIGADREEIVVERMEPDQPAVVDTLLYSQLWERFTVVDLATRIPGLKWEVAAVEPTSAPELEALAVQRLRITIPGDLPAGEFTDSLRLTIRPVSVEAANSDEQQHLDLPLRGSVPKGLAVYGPAIDDKGLVDLGAVPQGRGAKAKLLIKVRHHDASLAAASVKASPDFLRAKMQPHAGQQGNGLYDLTVELPADAAPCSYRTSPLGRVRIETGDPRLGTIDLGVSFAVLPKPGL